MKKLCLKTIDLNIFKPIKSLSKNKNSETQPIMVKKLITMQNSPVVKKVYSKNSFIKEQSLGP
jgi:hypothetical protein